MKKLLLIAAALTTMVSCSKTQVIPEETAQQEIAMKAFNQTAVKAPVSGTTLPTNDTETMTVYGFYSATQNGTYSSYFDGAIFKYQTDAWKGWDKTANSGAGGHKPYYWPSTGYMKFIAVYPTDYPKYTITNNDATTTTGSISYGPTGTTISQVDLSVFSDQKDIMYSNNLHTTPVASSSSTTKQTLTFYHLLSQVVVNVKSSVASVVNVTGVKIKNAEVKGSINVTDDGVATYTYPTDSQGDVVYVLKDDFDATTIGATDFVAVSDNGALVLPTNEQNAADLSITYQIDGNSITRDIDIAEVWEAGKKYVYNVTISLNEITFTTSVTPWNENIDDNNGTADDSIKPSI